MTFPQRLMLRVRLFHHFNAMNFSVRRLNQSGLHGTRRGSLDLLMYSFNVHVINIKRATFFLQGTNVGILMRLVDMYLLIMGEV